MPIDDNPPAITKIEYLHIRQALRAMSYQAPTGDFEVMLHLHLIDCLVGEEWRNASSLLRQYTLNLAIIRIVTETLTHHRRVFGLPAPDLHESVEQAKQSIRTDYAIGSQPLMIWSLLFYRYVRIELDWSRKMFCEILNVDERTITRHTTQGIEALTMQLIEAEMKVTGLYEAMTHFLDEIIGYPEMEES